MDLPLQDEIADVVLSINVADRVVSPRELLTQARRLLRPGGRLIFASPLNWTTPELWSEYPDSAAFWVQAIEASGFAINEYLDNLVYEEFLDARRSYEAFNTLVVRATRA